MSCQQRLDLWSSLLSRGMPPAMPFVSLSVKWALGVLIAKRINLRIKKWSSGWRGTWSHHLEQLWNLWRLFVLGLLSHHRSKWTESVTYRVCASYVFLQQLPWGLLTQHCPSVSLKCLLCFSLTQQRDQHCKGGLGCSLALFVKVLQRCLDKFPCACKLCFILERCKENAGRWNKKITPTLRKMTHRTKIIPNQQGIFPH